MKASPEMVEALAASLRQRRAEKGLAMEQIARLSSVHASQVSRVLGGKFRTLSHNVVQICKALEVDAEHMPTTRTAERAGPKDDAAVLLNERLLAVWDRTPADADRLVAFLDQLAALRRPERRRRRS